MSVILKFCLLLYVSSAFAAKANLCKGMKYLLKDQYIIQNYPNVTGFSIFETLCLGIEKYAVCLKKILQK